MYRKEYGDQQRTTYATTALNKTRLVKVDVIASFPSQNALLIEQQVPLLSNLVDFYTYKYNQNFKINFWIETIMFLPQKLLLYLGIKQESVASKLLNLIYWIFGLTYPIIKTLIYEYIHKTI
ncbi:hypothetical protein [Apilactobacillus quenuiae]|uniref:hypothetical protein n=1 Tax=Apilactobacillus quenuiae TaxID=2008377 RepID=UPI000D019313|nr:hypothetical protein [Apilactobacillus quenuiae]